MIFGRAGEEIAACRAAGIAVEVVPGITAAQGAASRLAHVAHPSRARAAHAVRHRPRKNGRLPADLDWHSLADPHATTAIYMPVRTLAEFVARATEAGLDPERRPRLVVNATRANEQVVIETIATLPEAVSRLDINGPAIVLVGYALAEGDVVAAKDWSHPQTGHA